MAGVPLPRPISNAAKPNFRTRTVSLLFVIGMIFITLAGIFIGGLFALEAFTNSRITSLQNDIEAFRTDVKSGEIQDMFHVAQAINNTRDLVNSHKRISPVFPLLEEETLRTVRYETFDFSSREGTIKLAAVARDDKVFAEQLEVYRRSPSFSSMDFDNLKLNPDDTIDFTVTLTIDPSAIPDISQQ